jgi:hypothetical protein
MSAWSAQSGLLNAAVVAAFGQPVFYQSAGGDAVSLVAVFEKATDEERHAGGVYARLFFNRADLQITPGQGDIVTVDGVAYTVFEILIDTTGGVRLSLRA